MKVEFKKSYLSGSVVVVSYEKTGLDKAGKAIDAKVKGAVSKAMKASLFEGKCGEVFSVPVPAGLKADRIICVGMGCKQDVDAIALERLGSTIMKALSSVKDEEVSIVMNAFPKFSSAYVGFGMLLRSYSFGKYKTEKSKEYLKKATVVCSDYVTAAKEFKKLEAVSNGIYTARDLVLEPPNVLNPVEFSKRAKELEKLGIRVETYDEKKLAQKKMNLILAVGQASVNKPRLVILHYNGSRSSAKKPLVLVGKGLCYDTGGLCLKPSMSMASMKQDMAGGAAVIGTMKSLALQKAPVNVIGIIPMVENAIGGNAYRPDDVITSYSGKTVEIINTDAEGRLALADALWLAQEYNPEAVINLATLTGAIKVALGTEYAGLFSNDEGLSAKLRKAGDKADEKLWPFPMDKVFDEELKSDIADFKHMGKGPAGSITAACFLRKFIKDGMKWAHLDIAGVAYVEAKSKVRNPVNATGFGVYLLNTLINDDFV